MTTFLRGHAAFTGTQSLLEELWAAGDDYGLSWPARSLLAQALTELTDDGRYTADRPIPARVDDALHGFEVLDELLTRMLAEVGDLRSALRVTRVREYVAEARRLR
jgi:hypothetical protein